MDSDRHFKAVFGLLRVAAQVDYARVTSEPTELIMLLQKRDDEITNRLKVGKVAANDFVRCFQALKRLCESSDLPTVSNTRNQEKEMPQYIFSVSELLHHRSSELQHLARSKTPQKIDPNRNSQINNRDFRR